MFVPGKPFQPSLMVVGKARPGANMSGAPERLLALIPPSIRQRCKLLNALRNYLQLLVLGKGASYLMRYEIIYSCKKFSGTGSRTASLPNKMFVYRRKCRKNRWSYWKKLDFSSSSFPAKMFHLFLSFISSQHVKLYNFVAPKTIGTKKTFFLLQLWAGQIG